MPAHAALAGNIKHNTVGDVASPVNAQSMEIGVNGDTLTCYMTLEVPTVRLM